MNLEVLLNNKKDFTLLLINILTPLIYEGFRDMYEDSIKISKDQNILIVYQNLLRRIPKWNNSIIDKEIARIKGSSGTENILDDLIKAVFKSNLLLQNNGKKLENNKFYNNISASNFVHKCYINCGRELYNYPYLFYTKNVPIMKLKKNQKDSVSLIESNIENTIRKMLPMDIILKNFLNNDYDEDNNNILKLLQKLNVNNEQVAGNNLLSDKSEHKSPHKLSHISEHKSPHKLSHISEHSMSHKSPQISAHTSANKSAQKSANKSEQKSAQKIESSFKVKNNSSHTSHTSHLFKSNHSNLVNESKTSDVGNEQINNMQFSESSVYNDDDNFIDHYSNQKKRI